MLSFDLSKMVRKLAFWLWIVIDVVILIQGFLEGTEVVWMIASIAISMGIGIYLFKDLYRKS